MLPSDIDLIYYSFHLLISTTVNRYVLIFIKNIHQEDLLFTKRLVMLLTRIELIFGV